jgi:hypothetical protein
VNASSGVATFAGCAVDKSGNNYTLTASRAGLTSGVSNTFNITVGAASQITLSGSVADLVSGATRVFTATIQDAGGNTVTSGADATRVVTFAQTAGTGTVTGTGTATAAAGVATKTLTGVNVGTITIRASATLTAPVGATNSNTLDFNVVAGAATQITLAGATTNLTSGSTRVFTATIKDANGNTVTLGADSTASITFAKNGAGAGSVTGLGAFAAVNGVASVTVTGALAGSFPLRANGTLNGGNVNSNTLTFTIDAGAASQITLSGAVTNLQIGATRVFTATIQDAAGNTVTTGADATRSVTFAQTTGAGAVTGLGAATAAAGVATKSVTGSTAGSVTLQASATLTAGATSSNTLTYTVDTLTILSAERSGNQRKYIFTGSGASSGGTVTVTVCKANSFPCSGPNTQDTVTATGAADGTWTSAETNNLGNDNSFFVRAVESGTSAVYPMVSTSASPAVVPSGIVLANGGASTAGQASTGDTVTITFNQPLLASSICSAWTQSGTQSSSVSITITDNSTTDTLGTITSGACTFNFGSLNTNKNYVTSSVTFATSNASYDTGTGVLTLTLGGGTGQSTGITATAPVWTSSAAITDQAGNSLGGNWTGLSSRF